MRLSLPLYHQKTALTDGFNASVDSRLSNVPHRDLSKIYHEVTDLSINKECPRGPDGIRTRTLSVRQRRPAINLPAQYTEAKLFKQIWHVKTMKIFEEGWNASRL